jgi:hypothetical protein
MERCLVNAHGTDPASLVDLERYPLDRLESPAGRDLVARCREALAEEALCLLPGFLKPAGIAAMCPEVQSLAPQAYRGEYRRQAYSWRDPSAFPEDHPRAMPHLERKGVVTYDMVPADSAIRALYEWDPLLAFVRSVVGESVLYRCADPYLSLELSVMRADDHHGWHFDTNEFVVSLMLQAAEAGGVFEYAPHIRSEADDNYEAVRALFHGSAERLVAVPLAPGTLSLFKGRFSAHRVTTVRGRRDRLMAIFSFTKTPDFRFPDATVKRIMRRNA